MTGTLLQKHWYDGWFYSFFIDSKLSNFRHRLFQFITPNSIVLDVGCGTGGFALKISAYCAQVTGIDISEKQIRMARKRLIKSNIKNVTFLHQDAGSSHNIADQRFDIAFFSFVLHEMDHENRVRILDSVAKVASRIIILDYNTPQPHSVYGGLIRTIEFFAGKSHFTNFKDFLARNGIDGILKETNLSIDSTLINRKKIFRTDLLTSI